MTGPRSSGSTSPSGSTSSSGLPTTPGSSPPTTGFADRVPTLPAEPYDYTVELPAHVLERDAGFDTQPADEAPTDETATLGRVLFYDVSLSAQRDGAVRLVSRPGP